VVSRPHPAPIVILGNQKSGTTAIASLLAYHADLRATIDFYPFLDAETVRSAHEDDEGFRRFIRRFRWEFSRELIKEPQLTFLRDRLAARFPRGRFLWVVRDPRDNLRSILNRLGVSGREEELEPRSVTPEWQLILDGSWLGLPSGTYTEQLAHRWKAAAELALTSGDEIVRYEDFLLDRESSVKDLAVRLGLPSVNSITHMVDLQFQRRGDRTAAWDEFFGPDNLARVEMICGAAMERLGYAKLDSGQ